MKVEAFFIVARTWSLDGAAPWARAFSGAMAAATAKVAVVVASRRRRVRGLSGMMTVLSQGLSRRTPRRKDAASRRGEERGGPSNPS
jgi:hypothetical protein